MNLRTLMFGFDGRISRANFGLAVLIYAASVASLTILAALVERFAPVDDQWQLNSNTLAIGIIIVIAVVVAVLAFWSLLAICIKRLHDRDKGAWWIVLFLFVPNMLGGISDSQQEGSYAALIFGLGSLAITLWAIVELACLRGTAGENDYGPDPLAAPDTLSPLPN